MQTTTTLTNMRVILHICAAAIACRHAGRAGIIGARFAFWFAPAKASAQ